MNDDGKPDSKLHPIDQLIAEHDVILSVLDAGERELLHIENGGPVRQEFWHRYLDFLGTFSGRSRHSQKENALFAALERRGVPSDTGPTCCLRSEHAQMQTTRARLAEALTSDDRATIAHLILRDIDAMRAHVRMENEDLFPLARDILDQKEFEDVRQEIDRLEAETDRATVERYLAMAVELCADRPEKSATA